MSKNDSALGRRDLLRIGGAAAAAAAFGGACQGTAAARSQTPARSLGKWERVRAMFDLDPEYKHLSGFLFAPHPKPVREAIEGYRRAFDSNPAKTIHDLLPERTGAVRSAAARFIGAKPEEVAMTDSTTMGLGLVYSGIALRAGQEIVTTEYDHYSTHASLTFRAARDEVSIRKVALFEHSARANEEEIVTRLMAAVTPTTRVVAVTWVHSMSGVKMPIRAIADALAERNKKRAEDDKALLIVDGVHGFGIDPVSMEELGADMFIAGTHKWVFGPRGTGLVWGKPSAWKTIMPTIPPFEMQSHMQWIQKGTIAMDMPGGVMNSPGGFHSFEHRWALPAAFEFQESIGRKAIGERVHELNRQLKEGLNQISGVELFTPMSDALSAGITCFMVKGLSPHEVVERLGKKNFIASTTPYTNTYARLAPGLLNTNAEIEAVLAELRAMA